MEYRNVRIEVDGLSELSDRLVGLMLVPQDAADQRVSQTDALIRLRPIGNNPSRDLQTLAGS